MNVDNAHAVNFTLKMSNLHHNNIWCCFMDKILNQELLFHSWIWTIMVDLNSDGFSQTTLENFGNVKTFIYIYIYIYIIIVGSVIKVHIKIFLDIAS